MFPGFAFFEYYLLVPSFILAGKLGEVMLKLAPFLLSLVCILGSAVSGTAQTKPAQKGNTPVDAAKTAREFYKKLSGDWKGTYNLWANPDEAAEKSEIRARFQETAKGSFYLMTYSWKKGTVPHDGIFLLGGDGKAATASWGDSFHQSPNTMQCNGELLEGGKKLVINGTYSVGESPEWGWRTEFTLQGPDSLLMEAYNIMPEGNEALAVKAELKRVGKAVK